MAANLLNNASATGEAIEVGGGTFIVCAVGTFGGATLQLQLRGPDDSTYVNITDAALTVAGAYVVDLPRGATIKMLVSGGAPSALYANISKI